jgi:prepilin-type N-terminal cleavage/methylation domain-containing protein
MIKLIRNQSGFTLIELLVVIGILAALAGVVTLGVTQFIGRGQKEACQTDLHNVQTAVAACMVDNKQTSVASPCDSVDGLVASQYLLQDPLTANYSIGSHGAVTQGTCP